MKGACLLTYQTKEVENISAFLKLTVLFVYIFLYGKTYLVSRFAFFLLQFRRLRLRLFKPQTFLVKRSPMKVIIQFGIPVLLF